MTATEDEKKAMPDEIYLYIRDGVIEQMPSTVSPVHKDWVLYRKVSPAKVDGDEVGEAVEALRYLTDDMTYNDESFAALRTLERFIQAATGQQGREFTLEQVIDICRDEWARKHYLSQVDVIEDMVKHLAAKGIIRVKP